MEHTLHTAVRPVAAALLGLVVASCDPSGRGPGAPPSGQVDQCLAGCGDGTCNAGAGEDCGTCAEDCGVTDCSAGQPFVPGSTALLLGPADVPGCAGSVFVPRADRGIAEGAAPLPFKQGQVKLLIEPSGCGGIGAGQPPSAAAGIDMRDGSFGSVMTCLTLGAGAKGVPVAVGLRYAVGRWREPDPAAHPGAYERPGAADVGPFWFASYSRRLDGAFPPPSEDAWDEAELPEEMTLYLEDYTQYVFKRQGTSRDYAQPGATTTSAVAFATVVGDDEADEAESSGSCISDGRGRRILRNDVVLRYPDGSTDIFSGRDLTFKGHIDNHLNHLVVTHFTTDGPGGAPVCGPSGAGSVGVKRIASFPANAPEPGFWIDMEHEHVELPRPGHPGELLGRWQLRRLRDSIGRTIEIAHDPGGQVTSIVGFPGRPEEQRLDFGYDAAGVLDELVLPASAADGTNVVTMEHEHPADTAEGGLSRVAKQTRQIGGVAGQTTTFDWSDGADWDLEVTYPNGVTNRYRHEIPQGGLAQGLSPEGSGEDRITAAYNLGASDKPLRFVYDGATGLPIETCDQESSGPSGDPASPGDRCTGFVYDADLRLVEMVQPTENGEAVTKTTYEQFAPGNHHEIAAVTGPAGDVTTYKYEKFPLLGGRVETVRLVSVTNGAGETTEYEWCDGSATCPLGSVHKEILPLGGEITHLYGAPYGTPVLRRMPNGVQQRMSTDVRGCIVEIDDEHGIKTRYVYASDGLQGDCAPEAILRDPGGPQEVVTRFEYDAARNVIRTIQDADGSSSNSASVTEIEHRVVDPTGAVEITRRRGGGAGAGGFLSERVFEYDVLGKLVREAEVELGRERQLVYAYSANGTHEIASSRSGIGGVALARHDAAGDLVENVDETGSLLRQTYSAVTGQLASQELGASSGAVTTFSYDIDGKLAQTVDPDGVARTISYDAARRPATMVEGGITRRVERDAQGRVIGQEVEAGGTVVAAAGVEYDSGGIGDRVDTTTVLPGSGGAALTTRRHYSAAAWGSCQSSAPGTCYQPLQIDLPRAGSEAGSNRRFTYDGLGRLVAVDYAGGPGGADVTFTYTYDGLDCLRMMSGAGRTVMFDCDRLGRTISETEWATKTWDLRADGSVRSFVDFNGAKTTYDLDSTGWRVGKVSHGDLPPDVHPVEDVTFTYLDNDLVATMTDGLGSTTYAYDELNRLVGRTRTYNAGPTTTVGYTYPPGSLRLQGIDYWGKGTVTYGYDASGRVETVEPFGGAVQTFSYTGDGRIQGRTSSALGAVYAYDPVRRLVGMSYTAGAGANVLTLAYAPDPSAGPDENGNLRAVAELWLAEDPLVHAFSYDAMDRITDIQHPALPEDEWGEVVPPVDVTNTYDARGNATTFMGRSLSYDQNDRITTDGFAYDENGNIVCLESGLPDEVKCHCYDQAKNEDEEDVDCGGADCKPCCVGGDGTDPPVPAFVGTPSPTSAGALDWDALDAELAAYTVKSSLQLGVKVPYGEDSGCGSISFQLPTPCGPDQYTDYKVWRMGGAVGILLFPPQLPQYLNEWVHNPGYYADGMMDPFYNHPAKGVIVQCQGLGVGFCGIGSYGSGTDDTALIPSDLARTDPTQGPAQPGPGAYEGHIRAFPVYQRAAPDLSLPSGFQLCYDNIDLHAQGGGVQGTCQNDGQYHGAIYLVFQARNTCPPP